MNREHQHHDGEDPGKGNEKAHFGRPYDAFVSIDCCTCKETVKSAHRPIPDMSEPGRRAFRVLIRAWVPLLVALAIVVIAAFR
jgi:hypothetical protein